ncbi:MAG: hypothetical protein QM831_14665 [Kofleriaceae bacterium]
MSPCRLLLLELLIGTTAFADDLPAREKQLRDQLAHAAKGAYLHDPNGRSRGEILVQLGDVLERQGKTKDAALAYRDSLQSRPSRDARERLQKLDGKLAAQMDPLQPTPLAGPYKDTAELCRAWFKRVGGDEQATWGKGNSCDKPIVIKSGSSKVQALQFESRSFLELAIQTDDGWYAYEYEQKGDRGQEHCGPTAFTVTVRESAESPTLRIEYTSRNNQCEARGNNHKRTWGWDEKGVIAIGVGYSQKPSGTPPIVTALTEWQRYDADEKQQITDAAAKLSWSKDSVLDVSGTVTHPPHILSALEDGDLDAEQLLGHHVLAFP